MTFATYFTGLFPRTCGIAIANDGAINMLTNLKVGEIFRNHVLISPKKNNSNSQTQIGL